MSDWVRNDKSRYNVKKYMSRNIEQAHYMKGDKEKQLKKLSSQTQKTYWQQCKQFIDWMQGQGMPVKMTHEKTIKAANEYVNELKNKGLSLDSIHTAIAALARGLNVSSDKIGHVVRKESTKGRTNQGRRTKNNERLFDFAQTVGIRKSEYGALKGGDLLERDGRLYVIVRKGKGGKYQEQLIHKVYEDVVREAFGGLKENEHVFSRDEMRGATHANLHALRRKGVQDAYHYYAGLSEKEREPYKQLIRERFHQNPKKALKADKIKWDSPYIVRNWTIRKQLEENGFPVHLDRFALLAISVLHLAHYREEVAVKNYLR